MRIVQMLSVGLLNGAARHCLALSEALVQRGHDVVLVHRGWLDVSAAEAAGIRCIPFEFGDRPDDIRAMRRLFREQGTEVLHTHMSAAHGYGVLLRFLGGPPVVASAHAQHFQPHWAFNDRVIALSETSARYHRRVNFVPRRRMIVIPSFLGARTFQSPSPEARRAARERLGVDPDAVVIGQLADVHFEKRQSDLIEAVRRALPQHPNLVAAMMGATPDRIERERVDRAAAGIEARVRRLPRSDDVQGFLHGLDIFAISSSREVGPMVAVEAMSAGLPIVSTRVGRMPELLGAMPADLLCEPRDIDGLARALGRLAGDPHLRRALSAAAEERALAALEPTGIVDAIEATLASVARPPRSTRPAVSGPRTPVG